MSRFTDAKYELTGALKNGRPLVCLTSPLAYEVGFLGSGWAITAEIGFCSDLASLPAWFAKTRRGLWLAEKIARSSLVHDKMRQDHDWPKLLGDYVFFEAMGVDEVPLPWRVICFAAVLVNFSRD